MKKIAPERIKEKCENMNSVQVNYDRFAETLIS